MKIYAYSIRDDELPTLNNWKAKNPDVDVDYTQDLFTADTVDKAKGADGIVTYQQPEYTDEALGKLNDLGIKNISFRNVGVDNINFDTLNKYDMKLTNVPVYSPNAIAEHASFMIGNLLRRVPEYADKLNRRDLRWAPEIGREIRKQTVGVIGTGHIGQVLIQIMQGYGAKVIAYDPYRNKELEKQGLYVDTQDEVFEQADIISVHVPETDENHHMINDESIAKMKDGVTIINVARGGLIDTDALIRGLDSGKVRAAGLDVYESENGVFNHNWDGKKFPDDRLNNLMNRKNVIVTPHTAFYTETAVENMVNISFDSNKQLNNGEKPDTLVDTSK